MNKSTVEPLHGWLGTLSYPRPSRILPSQLNWAPCQRALIRSYPLIFLLGMIDKGEKTIVFCDVLGDLVEKQGRKLFVHLEGLAARG